MGTSRRKLALALCCSLLALLALAGSASADSASVSNVTDLGFGEFSATFSVTRTACPYTGSCVFFPEVTTVPHGTSCGTAAGSAIAWVGPVLSAPGNASATDNFYPDPGDFDFCVWTYSYPNYSLIVQLPSTGGSGNNDPPPLPPAPIHTELIPKSVAHRADDYHFDRLKVNPGLLPAGLDAATFTALVSRTALRWEITNVGLTSATPGVYDGKQSVGFSSKIEDGVLGVTSIYSRKVYGRKKKKCKKVRRGSRLVRKCKKGRRYVKGYRVVDEDTAININASWNWGPLYPDAGHYDLETTLIHELGHFVGNLHSSRCTNSPMAPALAMGDWWHGVSDWRRFGCAGSSRHGSQASGAIGKFKVRHVTVTGPPR